MRKQPLVYILARARNGTLYLGVTSNLRDRNLKHKTEFASTAWIPAFAGMTGSRESRRKLELIERTNPKWIDLWDEPL